MIRSALTWPLWSKRRFFGTILAVLAFITLIGGHSSHNHAPAPPPAVTTTTTSIYP